MIRKSFLWSKKIFLLLLPIDVIIRDIIGKKDVCPYWRDAGHTYRELWIDFYGFPRTDPVLCDPPRHPGAPPDCKKCVCGALVNRV